MSKAIEDKLSKIPVLNKMVRFFGKIKLPGLEGLSLYDLLELYIIGLAKGALGSRASAIAYSFFMALFPFLLFLFIVIPHIPIDDFQGDFLYFLESFLPPTTTEFFDENIFRGINSSVGLISSVFVLSIFLMANGVNALFSGFENSYHEFSNRNVFRQYLYALGIAIILAFMLILTVAGLGYFEFYVVENAIDALRDEGFNTRGDKAFWAKMTQNLFFIIMVYIATATLYYFGTKEGKHSKFFSIGALFTTILILVNSFLFGLYIENFGQYDKLYGSIGAILILMFYLWLNASLLLLGFELNMALKQLRQQHLKHE